MRLYLKQLKAGIDFGRDDLFASQMANFIYLVGDYERGECMVVDPAWDISAIRSIAETDEMKIVGALITHYHPDHIGGNIFGNNIQGIADLLAENPVRVHVNREELEGVKRLTGLSYSDFEAHDGGETVKVGEIDITLLHTPGHTPGSQCFLVGSYLISGDTLFIGGCGRVDLPGGDATQMYNSLTQVIARLPDDILLYPGHDYGSKRFNTLRNEKEENYCMRFSNLTDWLNLMQ